jgi:hypothetical protein
VLWHWITPPIVWAKAVPLPKSAASTTMAIIIATFVRTSYCFPLEKGSVFECLALPLSRNYHYAHINSSIWGVTHPPKYTVSFAPLHRSVGKRFEESLGGHWGVFRQRKSTRKCFCAPFQQFAQSLDTGFINGFPWPGKSHPDALKMSCRQGYFHQIRYILRSCRQR